MSRLVDLGGEPFLIASTLLGVLAQRLVRCICKQCETAEMLTQAQLQVLNICTKSGKPLRAKRGKGCHHCRYTGLRGRVGIFELFEADDVVRKMIAQNKDSITLKQAMRQKGMETLMECGIRRIIEGSTTFSEVVRVCTG